MVTGVSNMGTGVSNMGTPLVQAIFPPLRFVHRCRKKSRLLKFCYVTATSAVTSMAIFVAATRSTNQTKKGRQYVPLISLFYIMIFKVVPQGCMRANTGCTQTTFMHTKRA